MWTWFEGTETPQKWGSNKVIKLRVNNGMVFFSSGRNYWNNKPSKWWGKRQNIEVLGVVTRNILGEKCLNELQKFGTSNRSKKSIIVCTDVKPNSRVLRVDVFIRLKSKNLCKSVRSKK